MKSLSQGKIFLADERGVAQNDKLKRLSTFNFGKFFNPAKIAIAELYLFNEDMIAGGQKTNFDIETNSYVFILPITGAVDYLDDTGNETPVGVEEALIVFAEKGTRVQLSNPYQKNVITYLCICLKADKIAPNHPHFFTFDLSTQNELIKFGTKALPFSVHIGRFAGRREAVQLLNKNSTFYAFSVTGAFEIDGRLLHEKDGLALWSTEQIELEALSNNAVILTLEIF
ncbi:MAG: hypothetical protein EOO87_05635 [Pedobacter sp.]|nr:MAG: hypothetical protein EOO87_05635 [Pedobacter sp.]